MDGREIIRRFDAMDNHATGNWLNLWQECADWAWPANDNINQVRVPGLEKPPQRMIDTCIDANFTFASGFFSHLFPPNTPWAKFRHPLPSMMDNPEVADYFEEVSRIIHGVMAGSNFAQEEFQSLLSIGCFGTCCMAIEEDPKNVVSFRNMLVGKVRLAQDFRGRIDTVARSFQLDGRQAMQQFGEEALTKAGLFTLVMDAKDNKVDKRDFVHLVCPRTDYDKRKKDKKNKPWASYYVCREGDVVVSEGGFDYMPYKVARFATGNDEVYGRSPMSMKLAGARRTNVVYRALIQSAERNSVDQILVPDDDSVKGLSSKAVEVIKFRTTNPNGRPEILHKGSGTGLIKDIFDMHEMEIKRGFFNHLFRPLEDYRNMTAFEANERATNDMMTLSPFVSRYLDEKVTPMMEHVYYICQRKPGLLPDIPQVLAESPDFEIDYIGRLSLATKSFEVMGAVNTMRIFGEIAQMSPQLMEAMDNVDPDKLFREIWYANSSSMNALKSPVDVEDEREARAEAQRQQMEMEALPAQADAMQKLSGKVDPSSVLAQGGI